MKRTLLAFFGLCFGAVHAQDYLSLQVASGFNADVIANGVGPSLLSTNSSFDNANFALLSADFQLFAGDLTPDFALPVSGTIDYAVMPGLSYQLAPYSGDNSLRLQEEFDFGSLSIANGVPATTLYVLTATGSGTATLGGTIHFSDNTTQQITSGVIPDWFFSDDLPVVLSGFGRIGTDTDVIENPSGDPRLYQFQIDILPENQTKTITAIDFTKLSPQEGTINIFAVSAKSLGTCPSPTQVTVSDVTNSAATISWDEPVIVPADGFAYYLTPDGTPPANDATPDGYTAVGVTTVTVENLTIGQNYCVWIRSVCSGTEMGPLSPSACFTPGQINMTNPNDIPTLYADFVDLNSTTTCPGTLTVNVPDGFHISSVATAYDMQTAQNGWMSEQNSILVCNTTGMMESNITTGVGNTTGTYSYERTGLNIANGASGSVEFELRAWRTYGGADCNTDYNRVVAGTWTVTVTIEQNLAAASFTQNDFAVFPNPAHDRVTVAGNEPILDVAVFNLLGQQMLQQNGLDQKQVQFDTTSLPSGQYILKITGANGIATKSLLKN
ncbi:T9SS type A sorting domain-containing protein [Flavobacterium caeni]|uniref:Por secretion system C-terminal sorting domain-containing protein n=1 Tax=Flavobacterium caeni TaxID=490189 RepID=A0A1G5JV55_9FLAO|nr:T9SS type A sorting domain-containing protein [Flavobacterium caeni]SCY91648.1 Por secretion system C-terminal sorting domain-containing protein [Flavobacterium caeni]